MKLLRLIALLAGLSSFLTLRAELWKDIEYGSAAGVSLVLDANVPEGPGPFPVAILIHGGGWGSGDKAGSDKPGGGADITPWFAPLTEAKVTWFSINYRLAPSHRWPACFDDVQTAIRWVKAHAAEFKGDPTRIALFGHSAGGQLACLAALRAGDDTRVQAVVGCAPVTDFEQDLAARGGVSPALQALLGRPQEVTPESLAVLRDLSPVNHVKAGAPPFLLVHGTADKTVPLPQSHAFRDRIRATGGTCDLFELPGAPHGLLKWEAVDPAWMGKVVDWLHRTLGKVPDGATVAPDGSGNYRTVQEAINAAPQTTSADRPWTIRIRPGVYRERLYIQREKRFLRLLGEDAATTVLTHDLHARMIGADGQELGTFRTPSVQIDADDFTAENLTFENSAGPVGQALALRLDGDRHVFRRCRFLGWQDTLLTNRGRHYFEECFIAGHVDFIFGAGTDWFERCAIECRKDGYITAASTPPEASFGYVFNRCRIAGGNPAVRTYLGRPWRPHAAVVFLGCEMGEVVRPEGWHNWGKPEREATVRYAESGSTGPGASAADRVPWAKALAAEESAAITVERVLGGADGWNPLRTR